MAIETLRGLGPATVSTYWFDPGNAVGPPDSLYSRSGRAGEFMVMPMADSAMAAEDTCSQVEFGFYGCIEGASGASGTLTVSLIVGGAVVDSFTFTTIVGAVSLALADSKVYTPATPLTKSQIDTMEIRFDTGTSSRIRDYIVESMFASITYEGAGGGGPGSGSGSPEFLMFF